MRGSESARRANNGVRCELGHACRMRPRQQSDAAVFPAQKRRHFDYACIGIAADVRTSDDDNATRVFATRTASHQLQASSSPRCAQRLVWRTPQSLPTRHRQMIRCTVGSHRLHLFGGVAEDASSDRTGSWQCGLGSQGWACSFSGRCIALLASHHLHRIHSASADSVR